MKKTLSIKEKFTKVSDTILSSKKLNPSQKLIISYVLRWQATGKVCFESNNTLAKRFGVSLAGIKKQITQLNKLSFFDSVETSGLNQFGKWSNSKKMTIDEKALSIFLEAGNEEKIINETIVINSNGANTLDTLAEFSDYVKEITNGQATDAFILFCFEELPKMERSRTKEVINDTFVSYITPSVPPT